MKVHQLPTISAGSNLSHNPLALLLLALLPSIGSTAFSQAVFPAAKAAPALQVANPPKSARATVAADYGKLPISFEANQGQTDPQVKFLARGEGYSLFLTDSAAVLTLTKANPSNTKPNPALAMGKNSKPETPAAKTDIVRMELSGASPSLRVSGADQLAGKANYFIGNDPSKWHANVPTYAQVKYSGVYPGVDLLYYGNQRQLEYDFIVARGADPKPVRLYFAGASKLKLKPNGDLIILTKDGQIAFRKPVIYQTKDGQRQPVKGDFTLLAGNTVAFHLGAYDHGRELVIDPVLGYATYLGGSDADQALAIAADGSGDAYITGNAVSLNFPTTSGAYQTVNRDGSNGTAFVTKLNPAGTALVYSTYLGGTTYEQGTGIAVDADGDAYVLGTTASTDFPVSSNAFQKVSHAPDSTNAFITKLNPTGSALIYSTYLGGSDFDYSFGIAVDTSGHAYVTGYTGDKDFPVSPGAFQPKRNGHSNGENYFVSALTSDGSGLIYSTYLGGTSDVDHFDRGRAIAVDNLGQAYVAGNACTENFPTTDGAFQTVPKTTTGCNATITELNSTGTALVYSTYLGGSLGSFVSGIGVDAEGSAYVAGNTSSTDFPVTPGAYEVVSPGPGSGFVTKLNAAGSDLAYSTYFGDQFQAPVGIALDSAGNAYLAGDPWLTELNAAGSDLLYSSSILGDNPMGIAVDHLGNAYIAGTAFGAIPVTPGAFQSTNPSTSGQTSFVAKFTFNSGTPGHLHQTIDFPTIAPQTALNPVALDATASSGLPVAFASNTPAVCTVSGDTATLLTSGSCDVIATQSGNAQYFATITGQTFLVHHRRQVITFDAISPQPAGTTLPLTATTDSELPITYTSTTPTTCTVSGSTATLLTAGTCTIQASQAGNPTWFPSGPKTVSFTVE
jgi:hypothetical protein